MNNRKRKKQKKTNINKRGNNWKKKEKNEPIVSIERGYSQ